MKHRFIGSILLLSVASILWQVRLLAQDSGAVVAERGPHHKTWKRIVAETLPDGTVSERESSYLELETGLHRWSEKENQWVESKETIELTETGAIAQQAQHQVKFPANINGGLVELTSPDGKLFRSQVVGLVYTEKSTGRSVMISEIQDSIGEIVGNQVIYRNAFRGPFRADVRYTFTISSFEQDIIIRESPPSPREYDLDPASCRFEVWSSFSDPPQPIKTGSLLKTETDAQARQRMVDPDLTDHTLDFGVMHIGAGVAFPLDQPAGGGLEQKSIPVGKDWERIQGLDWLIEKTDYEDIRAQVDALPKPAPPGEKEEAAIVRPSREQLVAALKPRVRQEANAGDRKNQPMRMASAMPREPGFVVDFITVATQSNYEFRTGITYYVNSVVTLSGTTIISPGSILKFTTGGRLQIAGPIDCRTTTWGPSFLTAKDDNTIGEIVSGSNGTPTGYYGSTAMIKITDTANSFDLHDLRWRYAQQAILRDSSGIGSTTITVSHSQVFRCNSAFRNYYTPLYLQNVLIAESGEVIYSAPMAQTYGEHLTIHRVTTLRAGFTGLPTVNLVNSLVISVTNNVSYVGTYNGQSLDDAGIFQTVGAGSRYLAGATYRNQGTTQINSALAAKLKSLTTYPPTQLTGPISVNTVLQPSTTTVIRDVDVPDFGYHYPAFDYYCTALTVQGATLTLTNGVGLCIQGAYGLNLGSGAKIVSRGAYGKMNVLAPYHAAQEVRMLWGGTFNRIMSGPFGTPSSWSYPEIDLRFTEISLISSASVESRLIENFDRAPALLTLQNCRVTAGALYLTLPPGLFVPSVTIGLTNNIFLGINWQFSQGTSLAMTPVNLHLRNNFFRRGAIGFTNTIAIVPWSVHDNFFELTSIGAMGQPTINSHNAYRGISPMPNSSGNNKTITVADFLVGPNGGEFYYPTTGTGLATLRENGSRLAKDAGLYHFTTEVADSTKEGDSMVDIGFHYPSVLQGLALDYDTDGIPDYVEDANGDGRHQPGETRWHGVPNLPVINFSPGVLDYYAGAGLTRIDKAVVVGDNDSTDQNFETFRRLTIVTAPGDIVRLLTESTTPINFGTDGSVLWNTTPLATITGGDGHAALVFEFLGVGASAAQVQALLRQLWFTSEAPNGGQPGLRTIRASLTDPLNASTSAAKTVAMHADEGSLIVDAGYDISVNTTQLGQPIPLKGRISSRQRSDRIHASWTLVEPVTWRYPDGAFRPPPPPPAIPNPPDVLGQTIGQNPTYNFFLGEGGEFAADYNVPLPQPSANQFCPPFLGFCYMMDRYRFRLTATDGNRSVIDEVVVQIFDPSAGNRAPEVNVRPVAALATGSATTLLADVLDESTNTLTYLWTIEASPGDLVANSEWTPIAGGFTSILRSPSITFAKVGQYRTTLRATDQQGANATDTTTIKVCDLPGGAADIMIVADNSGSMHWQPLIDLQSAGMMLAQMAEKGRHQIGLISFSEYASIEQPLTWQSDLLVPLLETIDLTDNERPNVNGTFAAPGLRYAYQELMESPARRWSAKPVIILITDGLLHDYEEVKVLATKMRRSGIRLITVLTKASFEAIPLGAEQLQSIAATDADFYVASSGKVGSIFTSLMSGLCTADLAPPLVDLGPEKDIILGQQLALPASVKFDGDPNSLTYSWMQITPAQPQATITVSGATDNEALVSFSATGDYLLRVTVQAPGGLSGRDEVLVRVSNADVNYTATVVAYQFDFPTNYSTSCSSGQGTFVPGQFAPGQLLPAGVQPSPLLVDICDWLPVRIEVTCELTGSGNHFKSCNYHIVSCDPFYVDYCAVFPWICERRGILPLRRRFGGYIPGYYAPGHYLPSPVTCGTRDELSFRLSMIHTMTLIYSNGIPIVRWGPKPQNLTMPHECFAGQGESEDFAIAKLMLATPHAVSRFRGFPAVGADPCDPCANWLHLEKLSDLPGYDHLRRIYLLDQPLGDANLMMFVTTWLPPSEMPFQVDAGAEQSRPSTSNVQLQGRVTHRKLPGVPFVSTWSKVNGPEGGEMTFPAGSSASTLATTVQFTQPGSYVLKLNVQGVAAGGCPPGNPAPVFETNDFVTIHIDQASVDAGPDQILAWPAIGGMVDTIVTASVVGPGGNPLWYIEPPMDTTAVVGTANSTTTTIQFTAPGPYRVHFTTDAGEDTVLIQVNKAPAFALEPIYTSTAGAAASLGLQSISVLGLQLIADSFDDELPLGSELAYQWECVRKPAGAECIFNNPRSQATWIRFTQPEHPGQYTIRVTASDGHLATTSAEMILTVGDIPEPIVTFEVPSGTSGNMLELFPDANPWESLRLRLTEILPGQQEIRKWNASGIEYGAQPWELGVGTIEQSGRLLRYTPRAQLNTCEWAQDTFKVKLTDQFGAVRDGKIIVHVLPTPTPKLQYEQTHIKRTVLVAGTGTASIDVRAFLSECDNGNPIIGPRIVDTALGKFSFNGSVLFIEPVSATTVPLEHTLLYQLEGTSGQGRFEFLLLPDNQFPTPPQIGEFGLSPIEVGEVQTISTFVGPPGMTLTYQWTVQRIDASGSGYVFLEGTQDDPEVRIQFNQVGTYRITVAINGQINSQGTLVVLPDGALDDSRRNGADEPYDQVDDPGVDPSLPGRARIVNVPKPMASGAWPLEIKDGMLELIGQAAAPGLVGECFYKVFLFPADAGDEMPAESDAERAVADLTMTLKISSDPAPQYDDEWIKRCVAPDPSLTPAGEEIGSVDLTKYTNGNYFVQVWARGSAPGGSGPTGIIGKSSKHPILLNTQRRSGKVEFAATDFSSAAAGGRLNLVRNYDSELAKPSPTAPEPELGWGWALSSFDLQVQLYEQRADVEGDWDPFLDAPEAPDLRTFNVRLGGPHHVTLKLPWNGRRVTFLQTTERGLPVWETPQEEAGQLAAPEPERMAFSLMADVRAPNGLVPLPLQGRSTAQFDFSGFTLTAPDGTQYILSRGQADTVTFSAWRDDAALGLIYPGPLQLIKVVYPDGSWMEREFSANDEIVKLHPTATGTPLTLTIRRDSGKVKEIFFSEPPPGAADASRAVVKYTYSPQGSLATVSKLTGVVTPAGDYEVTQYTYDAQYPHLVTKIVDPIGLASFEATWQGDGKLKDTTDASGIKRQVTYVVGVNGNPDQTITTAPYGNNRVEELPGPIPQVVTTTKSDTFGNVIETIVTPPSPEQEVTTVRRTYSEKLLSTQADALDRTSKFSYNADGRLEWVQKPSSVVERISYSELGRPSMFTDARGRVSFSRQRDGRLEETEDALGNMTTYHYYSDVESNPGKLKYVEDALGNKTWTAYYSTEDAGGKPGSLKATFVTQKKVDGTDEELTRTTSTYYPNGLLHFTTLQRTIPGGYAEVKTEYKYDAQGRVTETHQYPSDNPYSTVNETTANHVTTQIYDTLGRVVSSKDKYGNSTEYYYDRRGNLVQTVSPAGGGAIITVSRTVYDVNNRPIYQQAACPQPTLNPNPSEAPYHNTQTATFGTRTVYDAFGRVAKTEKLSSIPIKLVQVTDPSGVVIPGLYDARLESPLGVVLESVTTEFDAIGRVTKTLDQTQAYQRFAYEDATPATSGSNPTLGSLATRKTFVGAPGTTEKLVALEILDPNGNVIGTSSLHWDQAASVLVVVSTNSFEYDSLNRQTKTTVHKIAPDFPVYSEAFTKYNELGQRTKTTDPDGKVTDFKYDGLGRLILVTAWLLQGTVATPITNAYAYDEAGNLVSQTDALARTTSYEWDDFGRRIRRLLPGGQAEKFAYDPPTGTPAMPINRQTRTDFAGKVTTLDFDGQNRLVKTTPDPFFNTTAVTFTYTPWGARKTMTDTNGLTTYVYGRLSWNPNPQITQDSDRLVLKQRTNYASGSPGSCDGLLYEYDTRGNLTRVNARYTFNLSTMQSSAPNAARSDVGYEYNPQKRLGKVKDPVAGTEFASYTYDDPGNLKMTTFGASLNFKHTYIYNAANQFQKAELSIGGTSTAAFDYDPTDRPLALSGQRRAFRQSGNSVPTRTVNYSHDTLNRLIQENIMTDSGAPTQIGAVNYAYDNVGNRLSRQSPPALEPKLPDVPASGVHTYNANDQLASDSYDPNGNALFGDITADGKLDQFLDSNMNGVWDSGELIVYDKYDFENHLVETARSGKTIKLYYDGDGNRVRKLVTVGSTTTRTRYVMDDRTPTGYPQVLEEWKSVNNAPWTLARRYVYGLSRVRQERVSAPSGTDYYGYDGHGSVALLVSSAGTVTDKYNYDAAGVLLYKTGTTVNDFLYSGEQWDPDLGMYYLRARYHVPQSGRFWTMDSFEGNQSDPLSLHKYLYAHANPVNGIDPSGHEFTILGVSVSLSLGQALQQIYTGVVTAVGSSAQATIFGAAAGKGMNEILMDFVLEETGVDLFVGAYEAITEYFGDEDVADVMAYEAWREEVVATFLMALEDNEYGEYEIMFEPQCFLAGTPVLTKDGQMPVESIHSGHEVWAWNEASGAVTLRPVVGQFVHSREGVLTIRAGSDCLSVTAEHPFFVLEKGWTAAQDLHIGDQFLTLSGKPILVESHERLHGQHFVYNFEVATDHNYYVGDQYILTHNASAHVLRKALNIRSTYVDAHHIVAQASRYKSARQARTMLKKLGIGIDDNVNGIPLPRSVTARKKLRGDWTKMITHHGANLHSHKVMDNILAEIKTARELGGKSAVEFKLQDIGRRITIGIYPGIKNNIK